MMCVHEKGKTPITLVMMMKASACGNARAVEGKQVTLEGQVRPAFS